MNPLSSDLASGDSIGDVQPNEYDATRKDTHLVEAAVATDHRVLSADGRVRDKFVRLAEVIPEIGPVLWDDPTKTPGLDWVREGLPNRAALRLRP